MKERPILFSAPMVRAILAGKKTQTRRVVNNKHVEFLGVRGSDDENDPGEWGYCREDHVHGGSWRVLKRGLHGEDLFSIQCPYGDVGDRLWVRETWAAYTTPSYEYDECDEVEGPPRLMLEDGVDPRDVVYAADDASHPNRWRPSIHMPRWASRILLEVTDVRVERVQDITEEDAKAEGVGDLRPDEEGPFAVLALRDRFHRLWDSINAKRGFGWGTNPWVWVVAFKRVVYSAGVQP